MIRLLREINALRTEDKLHKKLISRLTVLIIISLILLGIVIFNIVFRGADAIIASAVAIVGFILGVFLFSRMNVVNWNEAEEVLQLGKMDLLGYGALALYIVFEIGLRTFLKDFYPISGTVFLLAGVCGTLFGRVLGTLIEIHNVFTALHKKKR